LQNICWFKIKKLPLHIENQSLTNLRIMETVNFSTTPQEGALIQLIVRRALTSLEGFDESFGLQMDLAAANGNGTPLDFEMLLSFDEFNFAHDIYGITNHINRITGKIERFLPRCYKEQKFAKKCSITGVGINKGWVYEDGEAYYSTEEIAEKEMIDKGYESLENASDCGVIYYTEWNEKDIEENNL